MPITYCRLSRIIGKRGLVRAGACIAVFSLGWVALRPIWDVDIFWHIAAGRWILEQGSLPTKDIFTYLEPVPEWYTFQWLYEVGCAWLEGLGGLLLVRMAHAMVTGAGLVAFLLFSWRFCERESGEGEADVAHCGGSIPRSNDVGSGNTLYVGAGGKTRHPLHFARGIASWGVLAAAFAVLLFALYADRVRVRPHVVNMFMWPVMLNLLLVRRSVGNWGEFGAPVPSRGKCSSSSLAGWKRWAGVAFLALLVFIWSNLHAGGSFIFLVAALAIPAGAVLTRLAPGVFHQGGWTVRSGLIAWGAMLGGALAAPHWARGVWQAGSMMEGSEALIEEWLPFWHYFKVAAHPLHHVCGIVPVLVGLLVLVVVPLRRRVRAEVLLLSLALAVLPFRSARFVYYDATAVVLLTPALLGGMTVVGRRIVGLTAAVAMALLLGLTLHFHTLAQFRSLKGFAAAVESGVDERRFPTELVEPVEVLAKHAKAPLKVYCLPNWGGYLLYRLYPSVRVIADGRGNFPKQIGDELLFLYEYRHHNDFAWAVESIYNGSGADVLVMQRPVFPPGHVPAGWIPFAGSRKGEVWVRKSFRP